MNIFLHKDVDYYDIVLAPTNLNHNQKGNLKGIILRNSKNSGNGGSITLSKNIQKLNTFNLSFLCRSDGTKKYKFSPIPDNNNDYY